MAVDTVSVLTSTRPWSYGVPSPGQGGLPLSAVGVLFPGFESTVFDIVATAALVRVAQEHRLIVAT